MPDSSTDKRNPYQKLIDTAFARSLPLNCQIEITYRCNHLCQFCYNSPTGEKEMETEQLLEALRKISEMGVLYVTLTGGEPLCHKDFFKIAREVRRLGMALRVYSNGYLLADKQLVNKIKELNLMEVELSIHGSNAETHEKLTKIKGSFERLLTAIANLNEAGIKSILKCPITRLNQHQLFEIKALADRLHRPVTFDATITPRDDGSLDPLDLRPDDEMIQKYWGEWFADLHDGVDPPKSNHCAADETAVCGTGRAGFTIDPYGNVYPCVSLRRKVANITEIDDLKAVWTGSDVLREARDLAVDARKKLDLHPDGKYFIFCPGTAEIQTGDPLALYPQAERSAQAIRHNYEVLQLEESKGAK